MSETLSQDPEALSSGYTLAPSYPATSSSDPPGLGSNLPPFSTFSADMDGSGGFGSFTDSRLLDISNWEYYSEGRLLERGENGLSIITSQPQYRPWESKPVDSQNPTGAVTTFADAFAQNGVSKLPSFQSQFQTFNDAVTTSEPTLTTLTPVSPNVSTPSLTTLGPNFHTLNTRNYPLVPAPIQAREIPSIQQQFLDERHIQLYTHPTTFPPQNGAIIQNISSPTVVTVLKSDSDLKLTSLQDQGIKIQNVTLHPTQYQNPMTTIIDNTGLYNGLDKKLNGINASMGSPTRSDFRKKERRKMRASSLESSAESDGASSNMEIGSENSGQVAAVSSTASFKHHSLGNNSLDVDDISGGNVDKQVKKKRKRCGECIGCQRKDNCGDCAPCRNDKSHQICKQRRCEKLTEKKNLYGDQSYIRGESRRGRGKGRGAGSYRGRKPSGPVITNSAVPETTVPSSRPSPQPVHMLKPEQPVQQQPMAPMPFYPDPNRFTTPVWQTDPAQAWTQPQFIQQIAPAQPQATLEGYTQQYPNGLYQATYQQPTFETNTFYTGAVQVVTNARPPSVPNQQQQLTPRTNGSYTPSPSPVLQSQPQQQSQSQQQANGQRNNLQTQYHQQEYVNQNYAGPATPPSNVDNQQQVISRPNSVNSNAPTPNQPYQQSNGSFTSVTSTNFSPSSNTAPNYVNASSGNERPGYPQVNSNPPLVSHNSSGYPGQYGGNDINSPQHTNDHWVNAENMMWDPNIGQENHLSESAKQDDNQFENDNNHHHDPSDQFNQAHRVNINSRIKTMILNKQEKKMEEVQKDEHNKTGHFLWYSHHRRMNNNSGGGGVSSFIRPNLMNNSKIHLISTNLKQTATYLVRNPNEIQTNNYLKPDPLIARETKIIDVVKDKVKVKYEQVIQYNKKKEADDDKVKCNVGAEIPQCSCFPPDQVPPEPGSYYTHLGCSSDLANLRKDLENRTGVNGKAIRIEKVCYTGKEGKTEQGCPLAKWIIRRSDYDEKYLIIVKHRQGHVCFSAFIVICIVAWEGVTKEDANTLYLTLSEKLNKFGLPTARRCATNEQRTCACQGLNTENCGASFSFGCSWSMYYNGCKFARSKTVRKFRLSAANEEVLIENRLQTLATSLTPLYKALAPMSFQNQCMFEDLASDCRLGYTKGRPFSGVTACMDFCAHAHKDTQNMNNGCTVVVTLTKERHLGKHKDEQLHVLPLYTVDSTDEFGYSQHNKVKDGSIEVLNSYQCEVRVRTVPLQPCRRKKRKDTEQDSPSRKDITPPKQSIYELSPPRSSLSHLENSKNQIPELQNNQISSTVLTSPINRVNYHSYNRELSIPNLYNPVLEDQSYMHTAFNVTYPHVQQYNYTPQYNYINNYIQYTRKDESPLIFRNHKVQDSNSGSNSTSNVFDNHNNLYNLQFQSPPRDQVPNYNQNYNNQSYKICNPFDDYYGLNQESTYDNFNYYYPNTNWCRSPSESTAPSLPDVKNDDSIGRVTDVTENLDSFRDSTIGGVAIALGHGSVLFECAKYELHATTALKTPNRLNPTRISLVFYQHRNLNKSKHGWDEYEEKMRLRKMGLENVGVSNSNNDLDIVEKIQKHKELLLRAPTLTTMSFTTLFPMQPCVITGPYQATQRYG